MPPVYAYDKQQVWITGWKNRACYRLFLLSIKKDIISCTKHFLKSINPLSHLHNKRTVTQTLTLVSSRKSSGIGIITLSAEQKPGADSCPMQIIIGETPPPPQYANGDVCRHTAHWPYYVIGVIRDVHGLSGLPRCPYCY